MKVLYVNHTSTISGGERSLLELLRALPQGLVAGVACPEGELAAAVRADGSRVWRIPRVDASLRMHPVQTPRGVGALARAAVAVRRIARRAEVDLVHANSVRAGLIAVLAWRLGAPPSVVHVRDCLPLSSAGRLVRRVIGSGAALVVANSRFTAESFAGRGAQLPTVYNYVDLDSFDPARVDRADARAALGLDPSAPVLGVVGQITPWKGQADAVRTLALVREKVPDAQLLIVGSVKFGEAARYDNAAYRRHLDRLVTELALDGAVSFLGERDDVPRILRALDLLLVPSWEEPFGRALVEALAMETPVVATSVGGPPEIVRDGEEGLLLPPRDPERWAAAVTGLLREPEPRREMGRAGRRRVASTFTAEAHVEGVLDAYERALRRDRRVAAGVGSSRVGGGVG